jgi:hypothetical protein
VSTGAIVMMLLAMVVIWGGFALAVSNLMRRGRPPAQDSDPAP